jgi:radical SAM superfamily enzyme YgiQ (UPF0313 family)
MYRHKAFQVRPLEEMVGEIEEAAREWPAVNRVFLGDGDALAAPSSYLLALLEKLREAYPKLRRVSLYATPMNLLEKSFEELRSLCEAGLTLFYMGLESGSDDVLHKMGKGATAEQALDGVAKAHEAGLRSSVMVLLGLGGVEGSEEHANASAAVLNRMQPHYLSVLTWMPVEQAPLFRQMSVGRFHLPGDGLILSELARLIEDLELNDTVFRANHASNPLPMGGRLSRDKARLLAAVSSAERGHIPLRPHFLRGT